MRVLSALAVLMLVPVPQALPPRVPVLVELFTSEGCSSCPPADALLSTLRAEQPVDGAEIVALELHVDYWDRLGWKDPASLHDATVRQEAYARALGSDTIYTPEAVVDGSAGMVGSDGAAIRRAVARAAGLPHVSVTVRGTLENGVVSADASAGTIPGGGKESTKLVIALVEDGVASHVTRGENTGRDLRHDALVRALAGRDGGAAHATFTVDPSWNRARLRVVAFLQGRRSQRVFGSAASGPLS